MVQINGMSHNAVEPVAVGDTFQVMIDAEGSAARIFTGIVRDSAGTEAVAELSIQFEDVLSYELQSGAGVQIVATPVPGVFKVTRLQ